MLPTSNSERETIVFHKKNGETNSNIAKWLQISISTITKIWKLFTTTGNCEPKPQNSGRKPMVSESQMTMVSEKIREQPDITLRELIDEFSLGISESALCRRLKAMGLSLKKRRCIRKNKNVLMYKNNVKIG
jgi:transposase